MNSHATKDSNSVSEDTTEDKEKITIQNNTQKDKTLTAPEVHKPEKKLTEKDTIKNRVIVISPYTQINIFLESKIPEILSHSYVDIVDRGKHKQPPYHNIRFEEKGQPIPWWIVDFGSIIIERPSRKIIGTYRANALATLLRTYSTLVGEGAEKNLQTIFEQDIPQDILEEVISKTTSNIEEMLQVQLFKEIQLADTNANKNAPTVLDIQSFNGYKEWAKGKKIVTITPQSSFTQALTKQHQYDEQGNLLSNSIPVYPYISRLTEDLQHISENTTKKRIN